MNRFIDIHQHILYGLDDGPGTHEEMAAMLRLAAGEGVGVIIATPHVTPGVTPIDYALMDSRLSEARSYCLKSGLELRVYPGAEVLFTPALGNLIAQRRVPTLAETRYVLLEFKPHAELKEIEGAVRMLLSGGYLSVLAHIERYRCLMRNLPRAKQLKSKYAVLYQMNCAALIGGKGLFPGRNARKLLSEGLIDFAATDAHDGSARACNMRAFHNAAEMFAGAAAAESLTSGSARKYILK